MERLNSRAIIEQIFSHYESYLKVEKDAFLLNDPNDKQVIGFHYGETHMGSAMIIFGYRSDQKKWIDTGMKIVDGFLNHAEEYQKQSAYHWDFNNFALCVLLSYLEGKLKGADRLNCSIDTELINRLQQFLFNQKDSDNATINWHPMRMYVNHCKTDWTGEAKYSAFVDSLAKKVKGAQYQDGFYEDLLPKGKSFNFQYHIYTTAVIHFLETQGIIKLDNKKAVQQCINLMDPCGDVNYLGRGTNQIFAWGPALYLYESVQAVEAMNTAWKYFVERIPVAIENNNIIMNDQPGEEKNWWWDYHYVSVYSAHLAFWLVLAGTLKPTEDAYTSVKIPVYDSGVSIQETESYQVCVFEGRKYYLAEKGPLVANICDKKGNYVFKGALGPFSGAEYGVKYSIPAETIHDYFGIMQEKTILGYLAEKNIFPKNIKVTEREKVLSVQLEFGKKLKNIRVNLPLVCNAKRVTVTANGKVLQLKFGGTVMGAYGETKLYVSSLTSAKWIEIKIR